MRVVRSGSRRSGRSVESAGVPPEMKAAGRLLLGLAAALAPVALEAQGIPLGSEFPVNTYTTGKQTNPGRRVPRRRELRGRLGARPRESGRLRAEV